MFVKLLSAMLLNEEILAVFCGEPTDKTVAVIVTVTVSLVAKLLVPEQLMTCPEREQVKLIEFSFTVKVPPKLTGSVSVIEILDASGPLFLPVSVKVTVSPIIGELLLTV